MTLAVGASDYRAMQSQLQCRRVELGHDATQFRKTFRLHRRQRVGAERFGHGVALFSGFRFISGFFQRIDQQ